MDNTFNKVVLIKPELTETQKEIKEVEEQLTEKIKIRIDALLLRNTSNLC